MKYNYSATLTGIGFSDAEKLVIERLKTAGFGIITEIDVKETFKKKLDVDFRKYKILGACNPGIAFEALQIEDKAGVFLPCNIIVEEQDPEVIEVTAVNPVASMQAIDNIALERLMHEVEARLKDFIEHLK